MEITYRINYENATTPTGSNRFHDPRAAAFIVGGDEFLVVLGQQERLRDNIKVFVTAQVLHPFDVLVEAILSCQFVRPVNGGRLISGCLIN